MSGGTFVYDACWEWFLQFLNGAAGSPSFSVRLNSASAPMTAEDAYGTYTEPSDSIGYAPFVSPFFGIAQGIGSSTATNAEVGFELEQPTFSTDTATVYGWWLQSDSDEVLILGGAIAPPITVPPERLVSLAINPITLVLGGCPQPLPIVLLSDTFSGIGSAPLGSDTPQIGGPWTVLAGTIVAGNGQCSASSGGPFLPAATPQGSDSVTVTVGYTAGTFGVLDVVYAVAYGTPSTTYVAARAGQGKLQLVTAEGGSTTYTTSVPISYTAGDSYTLTLEVVDQVATAYWQGQPLAAVGPTGLDCSDSVGLGFAALFGEPSSVIHSIVVTTP